MPFSLGPSANGPQVRLTFVVDEASLVKLLSSEYGLTAKTVARLHGGADALACTYEVRSSEGRWFVKVSERITVGHEIQPTLFRLRVPCIGRVQQTHSGLSTTKLGMCFVRVYDWLDGQNGFETPLTSQSWSQIGRFLRVMHELPTESFDCPGETFSVDGLETLQGNIQRVPEVESLARTYEAQIQEILEQVETLSIQCRQLEVPRVLCHSDIHIGNVLVQTNGSIHIVDWDEPRIAPRECDLLYFLDGGVLGGKWLADEKAFLSGYGEVRADPALLTYYRYSRVLADLIAYAQEAANAQADEEFLEACRMFKIQFAPGMPFEMAQRSRRRHD